jgi:hypothetical protein
MRKGIAVLLGYRLTPLLVAVALASVLSACGSSNSVVSGQGIRCGNYALQGSGKFRNEVSVRVKVSNPTAHPARYAVDVALAGSHGEHGDAAAINVTIHGSVASHASAELARKVLTARAIRRCRVTRVTRLGRS